MKNRRYDPLDGIAIDPYLICMKTTTEFTVGAGATYSIGSDSYPCTVIAVSLDGARVVVQMDVATGRAAEIAALGRPARDDEDHAIVNDYCEAHSVPRLGFERAPDGETKAFTRRANGRYNLVGMRRGRGGILTLGRRYHMDPSF